MTTYQKITTSLLAGIILLQAYQLWTGSKSPEFNTIKAVQEQVDLILEKVEDNDRKVIGLYEVIKTASDTIEVIEQKRVINHNTYVTEIGRIIRNDSTTQFREYKHNSTRFDSLLFDGFFFKRITD